MDFGAMFSNLKEQFSTQIDSFVETGVPAIQSSVEKAAIDWLQKSNEATQSRLQDGIRKELDAPPSAFGEAISEAGIKAGLDKYGLHIAIGVVGIGLLGYFLMKR